MRREIGRQPSRKSARPCSTATFDAASISIFFAASNSAATAAAAAASAAAASAAAAAFAAFCHFFASDVAGATAAAPPCKLSSCDAADDCCSPLVVCLAGLSFRALSLGGLNRATVAALAAASALNISSVIRSRASLPSSSSSSGSTYTSSSSAVVTMPRPSTKDTSARTRDTGTDTRGAQSE